MPTPMDQNKSNTNEKKRARESSSTDSEVEDSRILEKLSSIQDRIESGFTKIDADIAALKQELKNDTRVVKKELREVSTSLNVAWEEVNLLKENNKSLQKHLEDTLKKNCKLSCAERPLDQTGGLFKEGESSLLQHCRRSWRDERRMLC